MLEKFIFVAAIIAIVLASSPADGFWMKSLEKRFVIPDECLEPKVVGQCDAYMPSWFYNSTTSQCEDFVYGGCQGNRNRFQTQPLCEQTCQEQDPCKQPIIAGNCKAAISRWYYNQTTTKCGTFVYGGCGGNGNNFQTQTLCEQTCLKQDPCKQPKYIGDCRAAIPRWYYNQDEAKCEEFYFGGCDANGNNFESREECERQCLASITSS